MMLRMIAGLALAVMGCWPAQAGPSPSPLEPAEGTLRFGQFVLVDDGTCPVGQVKKVTAGNLHTYARIRICIPRH